MKYKKLSSRELVALCHEGDARAWETLILRYRRLIYSVPYKFKLDTTDCNDVFQSVCVRIIEHLRELKDETKINSWIVTVTMRQCLNLREHRLRDFVPEESSEEETLAPGSCVEEIHLEAARQQSIREAVSELPERCSKLLELLYFEQEYPNYQEVAQQLGIPVASIGPSRVRCLEKLRILLRWRGIRGTY